MSVWDLSQWILHEQFDIKHVQYVNFTMTYSLIGDHQVAVVNVDEGVLEVSGISGTHLNGFLVKNQAENMYNMLS